MIDRNPVPILSRILIMELSGHYFIDFVKKPLDLKNYSEYSSVYTGNNYAIKIRTWSSQIPIYIYSYIYYLCYYDETIIV